MNYLRRDEDPQALSGRALLAREGRALLADLSAVRAAHPGRSTGLSRWMLAYHWAMATGRNGPGTRHSLSLGSGRNAVTCVFRHYASDLFVLREVFAEQIYSFPYEERLGRPVERVLDLGSNIGLSPLYFSSLFPDAEVVCVEPVAENVAVLRRNKEANRRDWRIEHAAVASAPGHVTLHTNGWWSSSSTSAPVARAREEAAHRPEARLRRPPTRVPATTVGDLIAAAGWDGADIVKMDIEGAEEDVLLHGDTAWLADVGVLVLDIHTKYVDRPRIEEVLRHHGFRPAATAGPHSAVFLPARTRRPKPARTARA